jgi:hypothetical protein
VIIYVPQAIVRIWLFFGTPPQTYRTFATIALSLSGIGNAIVYSLTRGSFANRKGPYKEVSNVSHRLKELLFSFFFQQSGEANSGIETPLN